MSLFAEFFATIAYALLEATVWLAVLAAKPLQFVFSALYRKEVRAGWAESRGRQIFELLAGTTVLVLFCAAVGWWTVAFLQRPSPEDRRWRGKVEKVDQILQKAHDEMVRSSTEVQGSQMTFNQAMPESDQGCDPGLEWLS